MIRKTFNKIAAKTFVNKPKVHVLPPKAINLHFPNSINPEFKFVSLSNLSAINFSIKENLEKNEFTLLATLLAYNNTQEMDIASFKTKEEAEIALNDVRVALHVPSKSFAKWVAILAIICGLGCMATIHVKHFNMFSKQENNQVSQVPNTAIPATNPVGLPMIPHPGMNPSQIPPPVDNGEIDQMIKQLQEIRQLQGGMNPQQAMPQQEQMQQPQEQQQPQQPQEPVNPADQFLNSLN